MSDIQQVEALREIAAAIRELAAALRRPEPVEEFKAEPACPHCGSPKWQPGGMGLMYRKCLDCDLVYNPEDQQ